MFSGGIERYQWHGMVNVTFSIDPSSTYRHKEFLQERKLGHNFFHTLFQYLQKCYEDILLEAQQKNMKKPTKSFFSPNYYEFW